MCGFTLTVYVCFFCTIGSQQSTVDSRQSTVGSQQSAIALAMDIYYVNKKFPEDKSTPKIDKIVKCH